MDTFPQALMQGYRNFLERAAQEPQFYRCLAEEGQKPEIMVIGCCDSRVAPEIIFDMGPGDIFVTRNIANQVPPYQPDGHFHATSAALEYAVKSLKVKHIIVLGHGRCGGIQALLERAPQNTESAESAAQPLCRGVQPLAESECMPQEQDDFIRDWMRLLQPAVEAAAANALMTQYERQQALERLSLRFSIQNLRSFPWINAAEQRGELQLHAAWFDIGATELWLLDEKTAEFALLPH